MPERTHSHQRRSRGERLAATNDHDRDPLRQENTALVKGIVPPSKAFETLTRDNAELRRTLARVQLENRDLKAALHTPVTRSDRVAHVRSMLCDPASRNP